MIWFGLTLVIVGTYCAQTGHWVSCIEGTPLTVKGFWDIVISYIEFVVGRDQTARNGHQS